MYKYISIHGQAEAQDGEDEAQDGQDEAQGAHRSKSMEGSTAGADPQDGPDEAQDVQDKAPSSTRQFDSKKIRTIPPPHRSTHPRIPWASSTYPVDFGAKKGPSGVQVGSKSSQDGIQPIFKNNDFAWEGCQKSRVRGTTWT